MRLFSLPRLLALTLALLPVAASAQAPSDDPDEGIGLRFNGMGRTLLQQTNLGGNLADEDTVTPESQTDGEFVLDLALNAQPNSNTEVQGVIRFRNEFGGFFGAGVNVEVRELWARGVVADVIRYRVGDMDKVLTPYTLYLEEEDGVVLEPEVFRPQKEVLYYEEFYTGRNTRRLQGANLGFGLEFEQGLEALDVDAFVARLRGTNFSDTPTRLISGGRASMSTVPLTSYGSQVNLGANVVYTWDDLNSGNANEGLRNWVLSTDFDIAVLDNPSFNLSVIGEGGLSTVSLSERVREATGLPTTVTGPDGGSVVIQDSAFVVNSIFEDDDTFIEVGLRSVYKPLDLSVTARFVNVGPDFFSAAAQSKRVDFSRALGVYNRLGNDRLERLPTLFDLTRDAELYTFRVSEELMTYDPRYSNVLPYGNATPNRRGARLGIDYTPAEGVLDASLDLALLTELRGQGTTELKDFLHLRASADVDVATLTGLDRLFDVTLGLQVEDTSRGGVEVEQVDLSSLLFEAGFAFEIYNRLDVLAGTKLRTASGREYIPIFENFNDVRDFPAPFDIDDQETLLGAGLRYRFRDDVYLTVQFQHLSYTNDATPAEGVTLPPEDYSFGQIFALYSMFF
ncbi:MAG: hypothetical protein AAFQ86_13970 [Bacteroidota bacterium]